MSVMGRREVLLEGHRLLKEAGLKHWLFNGALLGIYRDGELIEWDDDVDICCIQQDIIKLWNRILDVFSGWRVTPKVDGVKMSLFLGEEKLSLTSYRRAGDFMGRKSFRIPKQFFGGCTIEYCGEQIPCLGPVEKYLKWTYTDWKTPNKSEHERDYNAEQFLGKRLLKPHR